MNHPYPTLRMALEPSILFYKNGFGFIGTMKSLAFSSAGFYLCIITYVLGPADKAFIIFNIHGEPMFLRRAQAIPPKRYLHLYIQGEHEWCYNPYHKWSNINMGLPWVMTL